MKKFLALFLFFAIASATVFPACNNGKTKPTPPPDPEPEISEYAVKDLNYITSAIYGYNAVRQVRFSSPRKKRGTYGIRFILGRRRKTFGKLYENSHYPRRRHRLRIRPSAKRLCPRRGGRNHCGNLVSRHQAGNDRGKTADARTQRKII